jgi:hypothetical protein
MLCDYQKHGHIANGYQTWVCTHLSIGVETFIELEVLGTFRGLENLMPHIAIGLKISQSHLLSMLLPMTTSIPLLKETCTILLVNS